MNDLKTMNGSFNSAQHNQEIIEKITEARSGFEKSVEKSRQEATMSLKDLMDKNENGVKNLDDALNYVAEAKDLNISADYDGKDGEDLLSPDMFAKVESKSNAGITIPAPENQFDNSKMEEEEHGITDLSDGTRVCLDCGYVHKSSDYVDIDDHDVITYMMGGSISHTFTVGPVEFSFDSLSRKDLDYCRMLIAKDLINEELPERADHDHRMGFYRLVFGLNSFGQKGMPGSLPNPSRSKSFPELEKVFDSKSKTLQTYGASVLAIMMSRQNKFEASIIKVMDDLEKVKN